MGLAQYTKYTLEGDSVKYFGVVRFYLGLFPMSRTHHRQSGRLPARPDQEGKRGPKVRPCHRKGMGHRDLNRK